MIGHRSAVGLSLLIALAFTAFAAQSASAVKGTTAFTCVKGGGLNDFGDAHCDSAKEKGGFGHTEIAEGVTTELEVTNAKTKNNTTEPTTAIFTLKGLSGNAVVECATVGGTSSNINVSKGVDGVKANEGKSIGVSFKTCKVQSPLGCDVKEPIEMTGTSTTRVGLGTEKNTMGVEFNPAVDKEGVPLPLFEITFTNKLPEKCSLGPNNTIPIRGTVLATGSRGSDESASSSGGTLIFTKAMTGETLKWGEFQAFFEGTITLSMKAGNPITFTTTAT